jgi:hypothetical protein
VPGVADSDHGMVHFGGVQHCADVVHPNLERRRALDPVGQAGPTLVEGDDSGNSAETLGLRPPVRLLPIELEVLRESGDPDERFIALAGDLVDVHVAAAGVARFRHGQGHG